MSRLLELIDEKKICDEFRLKPKQLQHFFDTKLIVAHRIDSSGNRKFVARGCVAVRLSVYAQLAQRVEGSSLSYRLVGAMLRKRCGEVDSRLLERLSQDVSQSTEWLATEIYKDIFNTHRDAIENFRRSEPGGGGGHPK